MLVDYEKVRSKKEYKVPQMEVMAMDVQGSLLQESTPGGGDLVCEGSSCP